jgi:tRNA1Val (adenine37-N6)-methyltransferase
VLPDVEGAAFIQVAQAQGWHLSRLCRVRPSEQKPASRLLFELRLQATAVQEQSLTIREANGYSAEFVALTQDFYLKM